MTDGPTAPLPRGCHCPIGPCEVLETAALGPVGLYSPREIKVTSNCQGRKVSVASRPVSAIHHGNVAGRLPLPCPHPWQTLLIDPSALSHKAQAWLLNPLSPGLQAARPTVGSWPVKCLPSPVRAKEPGFQPQIGPISHDPSRQSLNSLASVFWSVKWG